ncbi:MAG: 1-acyl-sn-glycerol-3-phosphate acyltransferase [Pirellulaceae bacterium]
MQKIIVERPYEFVPPHRGTWWPKLIAKFQLFAGHLRKVEGVVDHEIRHLDRLTESLNAGHGILITPNHCRNADPLVMGWLVRRTHCPVYALASWHLFNQGRFMAWAIRKMGGFSVNREGVDRQAINTAIDMLTSAERPLVIFPEGAVTRTNDRLHALLDGVAFIARTAAKRRSREDANKKVVVHPVGLKYLFGGDIQQQTSEVLGDIEQRLTWRRQDEMPLLRRVESVGRALLTLKELQYFGEPQPGSPGDRMSRLIEHLISPLEEEWLGDAKSGPVVPRIKSVRMKMLPEMLNGDMGAAERDRRWRQLEDLYLAQQISCYPSDYLHLPTVDRVLETVERFEEDMTDKARVHGHLKVIIEIGEAIEVSPKRERKAAEDPLMVAIRERLEEMLERLAKESQPLE